MSERRPNSRRVVAALGSCAVLAILAAAAGSAEAAAPRASGPVAPVPLPPALQALEAKLAQLQLSSVKVTAALDAEGPEGRRSPSSGPLGPFGKRARAAASEALFSLTVEVSFVEQKGSFEGSVFGIPVSGRLIGTTTYTRDPFVASIDHGRPWVASSSNKGLFEGIGGMNVGAPGAVGGASPAAFGQVVSELARARSIVQLAPRMLGEQPVTGFVASVPLKGGNSKSVPEVGALRHRLKPLTQYEVLFAEDGIPLLTRRVLHLRGRRFAHIALVAAESVSWINQPIAPVVPPPASETITEAQLERLGHETRHGRTRKK